MVPPSHSAFKGREVVIRGMLWARASGVPVAVMSSTEEQFVDLDLDYTNVVQDRRLSEGKCGRIHGHMHTAFYERWETFQAFPFSETLVSDHESVEMMEWMSFDLRALFTVECLAGANDAVDESQKDCVIYRVVVAVGTRH